MSLNNRARLIIGLTFVAAFILVSLPGPGWLDQFRPDWVALVLVYWCLATPERIGVGTGWLVGLLLDVLFGSLLGQQAFAKTVIAFLTVKLHLRIRAYPRWQQAATILLLLFINQFLVYWLRDLIDTAPIQVEFWSTAIVGMVLWPWIFILMRKVRRSISYKI